jgi:hypothetical protein
MNSNQKQNQTLLESLVAVSSAIKEARFALTPSGYVYGSDRPVYARLVKANDAVAEAIAVVSKKIG